MSGKVFERPVGSGHFYYRIPVKDSDGRYKTLWKGGFHSKREAEAAKSKAEVERNAGHPLTSQTTVADWLHRWMNNHVSQLAPKTQQAYKALIDTYILPEIGEIKLRNLKPYDLDDFYAKLRKRGIQRTTVNVHHLLRTAFKQAVRLQVMATNPTDAVDAPKPPRFEPQLPDIDQVRKVLDICETHPYGEVVRLCIFTGLRESELLNLRWRDIDLGRGALIVREAKHNSVGTVPLTGETVKRLTRWKLAQGEQAEALGPSWQDNDYVFPNEYGAHLSSGRLRTMWGDIRARAGITARFHDLRHLHASLLISVGMHAKKIQTRLRHRRIATTMDTYGHLLAEIDDSRADLAKLDELVRRGDS